MSRSREVFILPCRDVPFLFYLVTLQHAIMPSDALRNIWKHLKNIRSIFVITWNFLVHICKDHLFKAREFGSEAQKKKHYNARHNGMILDCENIALKYDIQAAAASWLLLVGYLMLPAAFASLKKSNIEVVEKSATFVEQLLSMVGIAGVFCGLSAIWLLWLWFKLHRNYVWLQRRIFL